MASSITRFQRSTSDWPLAEEAVKKVMATKNKQQRADRYIGESPFRLKFLREGRVESELELPDHAESETLSVAGIAAV